MGTYTVRTPSGATIEVEAEDEESALEQARTNNSSSGQMSQAPAQQPNYSPLLDQDGDQVRLHLTPTLSEEDMEWAAPQSMQAGLGEQVEDVFKSIPHYGKTLTSSLFGVPGDLIKGGRWLASKAGLPTTDTPVLGSKEISEGIEEYTGELHAPTTRLGKTFDIAAAILPSMVGGPGTMAAKLGTRVLAPASAAGVAGELTEGTALEPWAEIAALMIAPIAVSKGVEPIMQGIVRKGAVPTTQQLRKLEQAQYRVANLARHEVDLNTFNNWFGKQLADLKLNNPELRKTNTAVSGVLSLMADALAQKGPITLRQMQEWRQLLGKSMGPNDAMDLSARMYGRINEFIKSLKPGVDITGPDAAIAVDAMRKADALHVRYKNSQLLDTIYKVARTRMGRGYSRAGSETEGLQQKFEQLARKIADPDSKEYRFFTPEMRDAIQQVAEGTPTLRALRALGSFAPTGLKGWSAIGAASAATIAFDAFSSFLGTIVAAGLPAAALGGKAGAAILTRRAADRASDLIRTGGKLPPAAPGVSPGVAGFGTPQILQEEEEEQVP